MYKDEVNETAPLNLINEDQKDDDSEEYIKLEQKYTELEYSHIWKIVFYLNVFLAWVTFSIVLPSLWPYLQIFDSSETFLAFVVSIYSVGEFLGSIIWGYIFNSFSMKFSLYSWITLGLIGSVIYSTAYNVKPEGKWIVFLGRLIQGIWTGAQQTIEAAYISECIDKDQNLAMITNLGLAWVLGFTLGPIVSLLGRLITFKFWIIDINEYTSSGYIIALWNIIMLFNSCFFFTEIPRKWRRNLRGVDQNEHFSNGINSSVVPEDSRELMHKHPSKVDFSEVNEEQREILSQLRPSIIGIFVWNMMFFMHYNSLAVQETIITPISTDVDHKFTDTLNFPSYFAYIMFAVSGFLTFWTFMLMKIIDGVFSDTTLAMVGSLMQLFGFILIIDFVPRIIEPIRFIIGYCLICVAFVPGRGICLTLLSKIIGKHKAGNYMGYMLAIGALARSLGPFWAVRSLLVSPTITFGGWALLFLITIWVQIVCHSSLKPHWAYYIEIYKDTRE